MNIAFITFRESFEAALLISIILAGFKNQKNILKLLSIGILSGILLSVLTSFVFSYIVDFFNGNGEEIFNSILIIICLLLIIWHLFWMSSNSQNTIKELKEIGNQANLSIKHSLFFVIAITATILREGVEIVLFLQGTITESNGLNFLFAFIGLFFGIFLNFLLYKNLLKIKIKSIFKITSYVLVFIAANLSQKFIHELQQANILSTNSEPFLPYSNNLFFDIISFVFGLSMNMNLTQIIIYCFVAITLFLFIKK